MTTLTLSEMIDAMDAPVDLSSPEARLLHLASFLEKLPVSALRMEVWVSDMTVEDPDSLSRERIKQLMGKDAFMQLNDSEDLSPVAFVPDPVVHASCGFAACAIGWAGSCREFIDLGLHMVIGEDSGEPVAYPVFERSTGLDAVRRFFNLTGYEVSQLFTVDGYEKEVTPQDVAAKIRMHVCDTYNTPSTFV